jgi:hypothetical protein
MTIELRVHPLFFREFAAKTWVSPTEIVKELIENAFDEDATKVLVTILKNGSIVIEDDTGMDSISMEKFLLLGSPHKRHESISPKLKRIRTGRYGTGRLSFFNSFESMKIRTRRDEFIKSIAIDGSSLDRLFTGNSKLEELGERPLSRNGTELTLQGSKLIIDAFRLLKEIRKLAILRQPLFEVYIKESENFIEWDFNESLLIRPPDIQGDRIAINIDNGLITGELVIARRPLSEDERGIAVMVGNHIVTRSHFGFDTKLNRVTGYVRCDTLTSRFADKSALIEDHHYEKFNQAMRTIIIDTVLPRLIEYEDVLITREESKIYREIDKVLGQAIVENVETQGEQEVEEYEMINMKEITKSVDDNISTSQEKKEDLSADNISAPYYTHGYNGMIDSSKRTQNYEENEPLIVTNDNSTKPSKINQINYNNSPQLGTQEEVKKIIDNISQQQTPKITDEEKKTDNSLIRSEKVRRPIVKKTFALKKVGYKVIPYEDESDSRYSFTNENVVFVNKANSTYRAEAARGEEFLLRHIISIVAETIAESKHPEGKDALELQSRLVAEAIKIHDYSIMKKNNILSIKK